MDQLLLDLLTPPPAAFDNFVPGRNACACDTLRRAAEPVGDERALYLWGPPGSGRSHLLRAAAARAAERGRPALELAAIAADAPPPRAALVCADDVQGVDEARQHALFRLFNLAHELRLTLVIAGDQPPLRLPLREDLRTRLGSALVFELHPLSDADKRDALRREARRRGMRIDDELIGYLLHHQRRDLPWLMAVLAALDHASLTHKRMPTLPLLREVLAEAGATLF